MAFSNAQIDARGITSTLVRGNQINLHNSSNNVISIAIHSASTMGTRSQSTVTVDVEKVPGYVLKLRKFDRCDLELTASVDGIMVPEGSLVLKGLSRGMLSQDKQVCRRVLVKFYPGLSEENFLEEVKYMSKFENAYIAHLIGISNLDSPSQFIVLSDPTIITYRQYVRNLQSLGKEYRNFDKKYEKSFSHAIKYLEDEIDGLALECIFIDVRTVKYFGEAWIIVLPPPKGDLERATLSTVIFGKASKMLQRRLTISTNIVRCCNCLPSTHEWYHSLATDIRRVLKNVRQVQDPNSPEYETQNSLVGMLQRAEPQLAEAAEGVMLRSSNISSGLCGWCGERWGQTDRDTRHELISRSGIWVVAIAVAIIVALYMVALCLVAMQVLCIGVV